MFNGFEDNCFDCIFYLLLLQFSYSYCNFENSASKRKINLKKKRHTKTLVTYIRRVIKMMIKCFVLNA